MVKRLHGASKVEDPCCKEYFLPNFGRRAYLPRISIFFIKTHSLLMYLITQVSSKLRCVQMFFKGNLLHCISFSSHHLHFLSFSSLVFIFILPFAFSFFSFTDFHFLSFFYSVSFSFPNLHFFSLTLHFHSPICIFFPFLHCLSFFIAHLHFPSLTFIFFITFTFSFFSL